MREATRFLISIENHVICFFAKKRTGASSLEVRRCSKRRTYGPAMSAGVVLASLEQWEKRLDESSAEARVFYYNTDDGTSQWEAPPCFAEFDAADEEVEAEDEPNDEGWVESFNEEHGLPFYFNTRTGESLWEKPENWDELSAGGGAVAGAPASAWLSESEEEEEEESSDDDAAAIAAVAAVAEAEVAAAAEAQEKAAALADEAAAARSAAAAAAARRGPQPSVPSIRSPIVARRAKAKKEARLIDRAGVGAFDLAALESSPNTVLESDMERAIAALRRSFLLSPAAVSESQIRLIVRAMPTRIFAPGEQIFQEGSIAGASASSAFVVKAGSCYVEVSASLAGRKTRRRRRSSTGSFRPISARMLASMTSAAATQEAPTASTTSSSKCNILSRLGSVDSPRGSRPSPRSIEPKKMLGRHRASGVPGRYYRAGDLLGELALIHTMPREASIFASKEPCADVAGGAGAVEFWELPRTLLRQVLAATRSRGVAAAAGKLKLAASASRRAARPRTNSQAAAHGELMPSEVLALEQLRTLGEGSFGVVRLARRAGGGAGATLYALKLLHKTQVAANKQERQVFEEKAALCLLRDRSPFVVHLIGTAQTRSKLWFCLELCDGGDLSMLLDERLCCDDPAPLLLEETRFYAACVLCALLAVHDAGWLFRDLKPDNVLIGRDGYARIADFGLAKLMASGSGRSTPQSSPGTPGERKGGSGSASPSATSRGPLRPIASRAVRQDWRTYTLCGTPSYMSPEVLAGIGYGCDVDVWAFGVFIFELLVGTTPFATEGNESSTLRVFDNVLKKPLAFPDTPIFHEPGVCETIASLIGAKKLPSREAETAVSTGAATVSTAVGRWSATPRLTDISSAQNTPMFRDIDWEALRGKRMPAPWMPPVTLPTTRGGDDDEDDDEEEEEDEEEEDEEEEAGANLPDDGEGTWCAGF